MTPTLYYVETDNLQFFANILVVIPIYTNKGTVSVCVCVSVCLSGFLHEIQGFCKLHISCCFSNAAVISDNIYLGKMPAIISDYIFQIMYY